MTRRLSAVVLGLMGLITASGCSTVVKPTMAEGWLLPFDGRSWEMAHCIGDRKQALFEYVPPGQTATDWTEKVSIIHILGRARPNPDAAGQLGEAMRDQFKKEHASGQWQWLREQRGDVMYEWRHAGGERWSARRGIGRIVVGQTGVHSLAYEVVEGDYSSERYARWTEIIASTQLGSRAREQGITSLAAICVPDGPVCYCEFDGGAIPLAVKNAWATVSQSGVSVDLHRGAAPPHACWEFALDIGHPGIQRVTVTDVTRDGPQVLIDDDQPKLTNGRWHRATPLIAMNRENWPLLYEQQVGTLRVFRFELQDAQGSKSILDQPTLVSAAMKNRFRKLAEQAAATSSDAPVR